MESPQAEAGPIKQRLARLVAADSEAMRDPYPLFRELRERAPVCRYGNGVAVSRHQDVRALIFDDGQRFSKAELARSMFIQENRSRLTLEQQAREDEVTAFIFSQVSFSDGLEHQRLRGIAHRAFVPSRIHALRGTVQQYTDELLAPLERERTFDLMGFAYTLPLMVIADFLGVPQQDRELVHEWSTHFGSRLRDADSMVAAQAAIGDFRHYVEGLIDTHREASGRSELVAALLDAEADEQLTVDELASMFVVLLFAGHETTTNLISIGLIELLKHREQWERLCVDPSLAASATEELLRWVTPVQWLPRVAREDIELGGVTIGRGELVLAMLAAANRDPEVFADPEALDITREDSRKHLALGFGPHFCLGASLARLEGEIAFATLARRLPGLELVTDRFNWRSSPNLRSPTSLQVRLPGRA